MNYVQLCCPSYTLSDPCYFNLWWLYCYTWYLCREECPWFDAELQQWSFMSVFYFQWVGYWIFWSRYTQCKLMSVHYKQPVLLINFEKFLSFSEYSSYLAYTPPGDYTLYSEHYTHWHCHLSQQVRHAFTSSIIRSCIGARAIINIGRSLSGLRIMSWLKLGEVFLAL